MANLSKQERPCTCHPDDRPPVCQHYYAASQCQAMWKAMRPYTLRELVGHDLRQAGIYLRERDWRRVWMFVSSALRRPYWHRRRRHV